MEQSVPKRRFRKFRRRGNHPKKRIQQVTGCCEQDMSEVWVWVWVSRESWKLLEWLQTSESKRTLLHGFGWFLGCLVCLVVSFVGCLVNFFCWLLCWFLFLIGLLVAWLVGWFVVFFFWLVGFFCWLVGWFVSFVGCFAGCLVG